MMAPAAHTRWTGIIGAIDAAKPRLVEAMGCVEPTGTIVCKFLDALWTVYCTIYKTTIKRMRFDNGTVFDCKEVDAWRATKKCLRDLSAPYLHFQNQIERTWRTMQRDGACLLRFANRPKTLFIHACLHAVMVRKITALGDSGMPLHEEVSGVHFNLESLRIWGCDMYGVILPELRKAWRLDKSDDRAVFGTFIGMSIESRVWYCLTPTRIQAFGAAVIDEQSLLRGAPTDSVHSYDDLQDEATGADDVYEFEGTLVVQAPSASGQQAIAGAQGVAAAAPAVAAASGSAAAPVVAASSGTASGGGVACGGAMAPSAPSAAPSAAPVVPTRPKRDRQQATRYEPPQDVPRAQKVSGSSMHASGELVLIPADIWPRFACLENEGRGWDGEIVSDPMRRDGRVLVRFINAKTRDGKS